MFRLRHAFIPNFGAKDAVKRIFLVFHVTAGIVFIQLVVGGLFTFDYATYQEHLFTGVLVGIMSIVSLITALFLAKPRSNSLVIPTGFHACADRTSGGARTLNLSCALASNGALY